MIQERKSLCELQLNLVCNEWNSMQLKIKNQELNIAHHALSRTFTFTKLSLKGSLLLIVLIT